MNLREHRHLMRPEELTPEERLDRLIELLALASVIDTPRPDQERTTTTGEDAGQEDAKG